MKTSSKKPLLGCIADDFTGATDLANNLVRRGMRTVQTIGVPLNQDTRIDADAIVVALKTRTIPASDAISQSLEALYWLQSQGVEQIYFKYCSTFDSTAQGNIGPVIDALLKALKSDFTVACPAFPEAHRTIYKGHLFVGDQLLSDSGMKNHPLTPMTDANLMRVLQSQTQRKVGLVDYLTIKNGPDAITQKFKELKAGGIEIAILDVISNDDLFHIGQALAGMPLVTAGSGVAIGLPNNWGLSPADNSSSDLGFDQGQGQDQGFQAILSGSCSLATNAQVKSFRELGLPCFRIDPLALDRGDDVLAQALLWAQPLLGKQPVLLYATAEPEEVKQFQLALGIDYAGQLIETALANIATKLIELGVKQLVVAGGETSGAVINALRVDKMTIGPQIAPGVPWTSAIVADELIYIALKSGNFGGDDFFTEAFKKLNE